jgi:hypothetical protein
MFINSGFHAISIDVIQAVNITITIIDTHVNNIIVLTCDERPIRPRVRIKSMHGKRLTRNRHGVQLLGLNALLDEIKFGI